MVVIGETNSTSSSWSSWGWLCKTSSSSFLKGSSSSLGKSGSDINSGSFGWINEVGSTIGVLQYGWSWSSITPNVYESKKLEKNDAKKSWIKECVLFK